jgi:hypothetical protein
MARRDWHWVRVRTLTAEEKAETAARCEALIRDVLVPRYLPEIEPNEFNYPIALLGKWRGIKYSFIARFRSGWEETRGEEFEQGWARLDHDEQSHDELRFHVMWHRHTGQWWPLHRSLTLDEALREITAGGVLRPPV